MYPFNKIKSLKENRENEKRKKKDTDCVIKYFYEWTIVSFANASPLSSVQEVEYPNENKTIEMVSCWWW